jgi:polyisoprenoid-binding protein YceI
MRRRLIVACGLGVVVLGGAVGVAALFGSHRAPAAFTLSSPSATGSQATLAGNWKVAAGSEVGYRVHEQFINQPAPTDAVARTSRVSGSLVIQAGPGSIYVARSIHMVVDLSTLTSQDRYATFQVYQRDFFIRQVYLQTDQYPNAEFRADSISVAVDLAHGPATLNVSGNLSVHGVTKTVTAQLQAQVNGQEIEIAGSISVDMRDFNVDPPNISFTKAEPAVLIEFHLVLARA